MQIQIQTTLQKQLYSNMTLYTLNKRRPSLHSHFKAAGLREPPCLCISRSLGILEEKGGVFVQVGEEQKEPGSIHTKTLNKGNSAWSGCRRSTRKQIVPERPSNRLQKLVSEQEPLLNSFVKRNSANLQEEANIWVYFGQQHHPPC